ncbi:cobalamin-dependent protein [Maritimibacter sp. UBA3975]|uniref:cobalamin-dependent protein n=1 Tax=Maritimibacter sp. UBA3975 TaxID=1946833 RepID=UPI000C097C9D|nr:cobalamin-dependent protein [Maritimibacter sp. UBA3975]MAM62904.1 hypothetical protein [Maritimibacter sp.]|tara:strand:+ start:21361 stop:22161 length:801 start_codon:yes stop_codon:yes gene_type:complete
MDDHGNPRQGQKGAVSQPAIRLLVESALKTVKSTRQNGVPQTRRGWVEYIAASLVSDSETSHHSAIAALMSTGTSSEEIYDYYVPEAARYLGSLWVKDEASFVDVTIGAARLQALFRARKRETGQRLDGTIPLGESFLMVTLDFEDHSLGAFVAADKLRQHGLWVHMGVGMNAEEVGELLSQRHFSAVGFSAATWNTVEKITDVVDYLRTRLEQVPPIVIGGRVTETADKVIERTGADFVARTPREAIEKCGLSTIAPELDFHNLG